VRRRLWNIFCVASLLVFALSVMIWVRSWMVSDAFARYRAWHDPPDQTTTIEGSGYGFAWARGAIEFGRVRYQRRRRERTGTSWEYHRETPSQDLIASASKGDRVNLQLGQFQLRYTVDTHPTGWTSHQTLTLPLWLFLPAAIPPLIWRRRHRRRHMRGFPVAQASARPEEGLTAKAQRPQR
jgi:hypothetical protein